MLEAEKHELSRLCTMPPKGECHRRGEHADHSSRVPAPAATSICSIVDVGEAWRSIGRVQRATHADRGRPGFQITVTEAICFWLTR
jgi:hypothetical protein